MVTPEKYGEAPSVSDKKALSKAYRVAQYAFCSAAGMIFCMPDRTLTTLLATKWGGSAGFAIAAGLCRILRTANEQDRLASETYKRLNLGLLGFTGLGLTAVPGEAAFLNSSRAAMVMAGFLTVLRLFGTVLAFTGWKRGVTDIQRTFNLFCWQHGKIKRSTMVLFQIAVGR